MAGVRTGDRGRGRHGEPLPTFEAGNDVVAGLTVLAEGTQGYLTGAAIDQFGLHGENPQIWALGVKEVWRVRKPLRKIIHTMGWPLRTSASFGEFGGSFIYPMGDDLVTVGFVAGLESADVEFSVHDVLQEFKTHRFDLEDPRRRRAGRVGGQDDHGGRLLLAPEPVQRARAVAGRGRRRARQRAAPEGRSLRDRVGPPGRRSGVPCTPARRGAEPRRRARLLRRVAEREQADEGAVRGAQHASGLRQGLLHGRCARERDDGHQGPCSERPLPDPSERVGVAEEDGSGVALSDSGRQVHLRQALVRLRLGQPHARRPAQSPQGAHDGSPAGRGGVGVDVSCARVRGRP